MASAPALVRASDPIERAGRALASALAAQIESRGEVHLAIPGGSALAALEPARSELGERFERVALTWIDERCVPEASDESNRGAAMRAGLLGPPHPPACTVPLFLDGETPDAAAERTTQQIDEQLDGRLDVVLLGMGEDGHIASLFPGATEHTGPRAVHISDSPKPPSDRITLTRSLLASAGTCVLVAIGESKRSAVERMLDEDPALPASGLDGLIIVTDLEDLGGRHA